MKINEVLTEGPILQKAGNTLAQAGSAIKRGVTGAVTGFQNAAARRKAAQVAQPNIDNAVDKWNQYVAQRSASADMTNPQVYQAELQKWMNSRYPSANNVIDVSTVNPNNGSTVSKYIGDMYNTAMANRSMRSQEPGGGTAPQATAQPQTTTSSDGTQTTPAGIVVPSSVGAGPRPRAEQPQDAQQTAQQAQAAGIKIINQDPIVIDYKNSHFGLNDQGQWMHMKSGKVPPQAMQAFLSQQHDISLGTV